MEAETSSINGRENLCDNKQVEDKSIQDNSHHNLTADQQAVREKKLVRYILASYEAHLQAVYK